MFNFGINVMNAGRMVKALGLVIVLLCFFAGVFHFTQGDLSFKEAIKEIVEKEYTALEQEAFILDALLNVKNPPPEKTVFENYEAPSSSDINWSPKKNTVYKFSETITLGLIGPPTKRHNPCAPYAERRCRPPQRN